MSDDPKYRSRRADLLHELTGKVKSAREAPTDAEELRESREALTLALELIGFVETSTVDGE